MSQGKGKRHSKSALELSYQPSLKGRDNSRSPVSISLPKKPCKGPLQAPSWGLLPGQGTAVEQAKSSLLGKAREAQASL